jgi:malate dehydrogenase (oxaloacetate-decarboxylating)(NADP+)
VIAALAVRRNDADAMICGLEGRFRSRLRYIKDIIGLAPAMRDFAAMSLMIAPRGAFFVADTHVRDNPTATEIADMTILCAEHVSRFGMQPKIALVSHSDFGEAESTSALKMREALALIRTRNPKLEVDGEMQADTALLPLIRDRVFPNSTLKGEANVLIMPNLDAANVAFQLTKTVADALPVGPILIGVARPAHVLTASVTARGIVNMTAIAVAEAQAAASEQPSPLTPAGPVQ